MLALIKKNLVLIGVIVAAAALLYFYSSSGSDATLTSTDGAQSPVSNELLATLGNLRTIQLDNSIFKEPLFMSLSDFGVAIPPVAAGRRNPFAPVGQGGAPVQTATSSGTTTQAR